jgi:serine/threonine-protein kinase
MRERVPGYHIRRRLGGGGMGEVFEAVHDRLGRRVAVKFLHPQLCAQPEVAVRFLNEARAVNLVRHASLVDIYEIGQLDDGALYIVMELLEGETLSARLRSAGAMLPAEAARLGRQIAAALAAAHASGVVHRDLKPDNVMLVADAEVDGGLRAKVLDFGIAKILRPGDDVPASLTRTGLILGTPQYMAPEQCRGSRDVDGKADVYALGLILWEAIVGAPPFSAVSEWELMSMHLNQLPPPLPSTVPPGLTALLARMLQKEPETRLAMSDVVARLGELRTGGRHDTLAATTPTTLPARTLALPASTAQPRTTLGGAAAELRGTRRTVGAAWLLPAACAVALSTLAVGAWLRKQPRPQLTPAPEAPRAQEPARPSPPPPAPPTVRWTVTSLPSGASIDRDDTGEHLGITPWHREAPAADGTVPVTLTLHGYRPRTVTLDRAGDEHRQIQLRALRRAEPTRGDDDDVQTVH